MTRREKLIGELLSGRADANFDFDDLRGILLGFEFSETIRGSHHVFRRAGIDERVNLQRDGRHAKPYQVKQVRAVVVKYRLAGDEE